jgi:peptidoglycan/LPS O-acetylase OafA/YrhL
VVEQQFAALVLPNLGMTLFFVLSGFVIHLNYHATVGTRRGNRDFFVARFSRLYPLFLAVFAVEFFRLMSLLGYFTGTPRHDFDLVTPLPFFLTLSQTWLFIPFGDYALHEHYGTLTGQIQATGAMWSLSIEWLFYCLYPCLGGWLFRRRGKSLAALALVVALCGILYAACVAYSADDIRSFGLARFGSPSLSESFMTWIAFYGPLRRFPEFMLGACAAQYVLTSSASKHRRPRRPAAWSLGIAAASMVLAIGVPLFRAELLGVLTPCIAVLLAALLFMVARHGGPLSRFLGSAFLVKAGEASYSLYLLHWYTMHQWAASYAADRSGSARFAVYLVGIAASVLISRVAYLSFERPALRWLRSRHNRRTLRVALEPG